MAGTARDSTGTYVRDPDVAERDALAMRMRARGATLREIKEELGYSDTGHVYHQITRAYRQNMAPAVNELRAQMDGQLDEIYAAVLKVLETQHLKVVNGSVVFNPETGGLMEDDAPVLAAADRLLKVLERRAKLYGLDAPTKVQAQVENVRVTVDGAEDV
jgi:hypothetical protein